MIISDIMAVLNSKIDGKKTYATVAVTVLSCFVSYFLGQVTLLECLNLAIPAVLAALIRHGVTTDATKAAQTAVVTSYVLNNNITPSE